MTSRGMSLQDAYDLGVAHELDSDDTDEEWGSQDSVADLHNNNVGAQVGVEALATAAVDAYMYKFDTSPEKIMISKLRAMVDQRRELDFSSTHG
ncbi:hypothetical protein ACFPIJ_52000 [Dactylosporangium cerinum]|uniref:Uncharacterized protein n=1 Tax=Dactylosporangium cerinum TaxID=1434730 RepID=A0ABV9WDA8_9ACTN